MIHFLIPTLIRHPDNEIIECFSDMDTGIRAKKRAVEADTASKYDYELRHMGIDQTLNMLVNRINEMQQELNEFRRLADNFNQM